MITNTAVALGETNSNSLFRFFHPSSSARIRLVCIPYAGGGASTYFHWARMLPSDVELCAVQLPARQDRLNDAPITRLVDAAKRIADALDTLSPLPTVLFGHSFGALVAFEAARSKEASNARSGLEAVIVSGRRAPQLGQVGARIYDLPEAEFLKAVHMRYSTPWSILNDSSLMRIVLPALRADLEALETYEYQGTAPLSAPITVLRGTRDASVTPSEAAAWTELSYRGISLHEVDAGHFFVDSHRSWVVSRVMDVLAAAAT